MMGRWLVMGASTIAAKLKFDMNLTNSNDNSSFQITNLYSCILYMKV